MVKASVNIVTDLIRDAAHPLTGVASDYDPFTVLKSSRVLSWFHPQFCLAFTRSGVMHVRC